MKPFIQSVTADIDAILNRFSQFGVDLGLERIQQLLADLGNPHLRVPIIHVAGSNGKGSVCAYLSAVLTAAGLRTGRYTSPHLMDWTERICLNEQPIPATDLRQALEITIAAIRPELPSPTQFEVLTAAAWVYFAQQQVGIAVIEVGLGGRLDATNVCDRPLASIITSISREHWQRLGPTLADIAKEKAGILKPGCPAIIGPLPPEAAAVVNQRVQDLHCPVLMPAPALPAPRSEGAFPWVTAQGITYPLPLPGEIQWSNSALAIAALQILQQQGWPITEEAIITGMAKTVWPARLQWTTYRGQRLLIDGAHNPASAVALRQYLDAIQAPKIRWLIGMLSTKDHADVFQALLRPGDRLYVVPVPDHASARPEQLVTLAASICPELKQCQAYPDLATGLDAAMSLAHGTDSTPEATLPVLCGSLYLIGDFMKRHWQQ